MADSVPTAIKPPNVNGHAAKAPPRKLRVADGLAANPLALVAGGLTLGVVAGALLPRSERERDLLGPVGAKVGDALSAAIAAAREAGQSELDGLGINRDAARDQIKTLVDGLIKAASSAGSAAAQAAATSAKGEG